MVAHVFRHAVCLVALLLGHGVVNADSPHSVIAVLEPVTKRIQSFNDHNLQGYLAAHNQNVQIFEFPDKPIGVGRAHLKRIFGPLLERGVGSVKVIHQSVIGNRVVSEEHLSYGSGHSDTLVAIYTVDQGLIASIYLVETDN